MKDKLQIFGAGAFVVAIFAVMIVGDLGGQVRPVVSTPDVDSLATASAAKDTSLENKAQADSLTGAAKDTLQDNFADSLAAASAGQDTLQDNRLDDLETAADTSGGSGGGGAAGIVTLTITRTGGGGDFACDSTLLDSVLPLALDSLNDIGGGSIGIIGKFSLDDTVFIKTSHVSIIGEINTTAIVCNHDGFAIIDTAGISGLRIAGIRWRGVAACHGIFASLPAVAVVTDTLLFENNIVENFPDTDGTIFQSDSLDFYWTIRNNQFFDIDEIVTYGAKVNIRDNRIYRCAEHGIRFNPPGSSVTDNYIEGAAGSVGISGEFTAYYSQTFYNSNFQISDNYITWPDTSTACIGVEFPNAVATQFTGGAVSNNMIIGYDPPGANDEMGYGIVVTEHSLSLTMHGNSIMNMNFGISLGAEADGVMITGGLIRNCNTDGIEIKGDKNSVVGVKFHSNDIDDVDIDSGNLNGVEALGTTAGVTDGGTNTYLGATGGLFTH